MTMLDKARKATEQAAKAAKAEEAARVAEEAAAKAREAARQAQQAAEEAAAAAEEPEEPTTEDSDPEPAAKPTRTRVVRLTKPTEPTDPEDAHTAGPGYTVIAILAVIVIVLATAAITLFLKDRDQNAVDHARKEASWAASRAAQELSAYDYRTIDADVKTAASLTTGKLHTDYEKQIPAFKAEAVKKQLIGTTTVMKTGVITATSTKVVVLIYANRSSTTKDDKTQRLPEALRLKVTMQKTNGTWLAAKMEVIS
ncbi:hypothetical protein GCM10022254_38130 [Actinomadura meridiana]|uniref:Mce-associated membrane protein n=1 Tax=Actinomadura meridiana TaxID=559626 RepID=A0ABP8C5M0_9ACTN